MFKIDNEVIRDYLVSAGVRRPPDGKLHLLGLRGARVRGQDASGITISVEPPRPNSYDDAVGFFGADLGLYQGTVDPGRNWTLYPMRPEGCAHIADGGPYLQRVGLHRGYPAFVQAGPIRIWRDKDRDHQHDESEREHFETGNGLDIHRMGRAGPGINAWSAGCLGVIVNLWPQFWERAAHNYLQTTYNLYVVDGLELGTWFDANQG